MQKYIVLKHFQWGQLKLDKGEKILIDDLGPNEIGNLDSLVSVEHYPDRNQLVNTKAVDSMVLLKKIKKY